MSARIDTHVTVSDAWARLKERMNEHAGKMQLGIRDIGATLLVSILGSALSIGIFVGGQAKALDAETKARESAQKEVEARVDRLEAARLDLRDHDKLVELGTKMDQLKDQLGSRDTELQRQISDFILRQEKITAYGVGTQQKGRP